MKHTQEVVQMPLSSLVPDRFNPRQDFNLEDMARLELSVKSRGILNPILVEKVDGKYLIIDGERRFRVASRLGMKAVPVRISATSMTDKDRLLVRFNLQEVHSAWSSWDKSVAIAELQEMTDWNPAEMARQLGLARSTVSGLLALQQLSKRTISAGQKVKLPSEIISKIGYATKKMDPTKAKAVEEAFVAGVDQGKIFDRKTANRFLTACGTGSTAQIEKFKSTKGYTSENILKDNKAEHAHVERLARFAMTSAASQCKKLAAMLTANSKLAVEEKTLDNARRNVVAIERLIKTIGGRVKAKAKEE